jgi:oxygen-dependent protoporphyrinogen oxidase
MMHKKSVIILGGGISGIAAAWKHRNDDAVVLEGSSRLGGWIHTIQKDGFQFELGPRSCRTYGKGMDTVNLVHELGLSHEILPADPAAQVRYLLHHGSLVKLPTGLMEWIRSPFLPLLAKALWSDMTSPKILADCSIADFGRARNLDFFLTPLVSGVYAGDPEHLSMQTCFTSLFDIQKEYRSILKGLMFNRLTSKAPFPLFTLKRGLSSLVETIVEKVGSDKFYTGSPVMAVEKEGTGWRVHLESGESFSGERVISTLPPTAVESLWGFKAPPLGSVAVVNLGFRKLDLPVSGFGYLIPKGENEKALGVVWDSKVFPSQHQNGATSLTVMIGGTTAPAGWEDWDFKAIALDVIRRHLGIDAQPDVVHITLAKNAIPQYEVGFEERKKTFLKEAEQRWPGVEFGGALFKGVSINDCISSQCKF